MSPSNARFASVVAPISCGGVSCTHHTNGALLKVTSHVRVHRTVGRSALVVLALLFTVPAPAFIEFEAEEPIAVLYPLGLATGDFDQDGLLDVAVTRAANNDVAIYLGDGEGGFGSPETVEVHHPR